MTALSLDGPWTLSALGDTAIPPARGTITATVPGCVHLDLLAAGIIADPFDGDNENAHQWIGDTAWRYARSFTWNANGHDRHDLVADGLDTFATVTVNGTVVALTENQNRSYRWNIAHLLREGENEITVDFAAPVPEAERREREHGGALFHVNHHPYNTVRKTASNFGWDWGIDVATSGIWKSIRVESWSTVRIAAIRPLATVRGTTGLLDLHIDLQHDGLAADALVEVVVRRDGTEVASAHRPLRRSGVLALTVDDVQLWWPRGHGEQPLYDVEVRVGDDGWSRALGFRTVAIVTENDEHGSPFEIHVNGRRILIRGANWIPDDAFVTRIDRARLERRIADATEANMNLLRVWGGGMYESDEFYEICTREGVLVWQDFLLACAAYAEEPWLADEIEAEAREALTRLSQHTSLVLWSGNNENLVGYADWGWRGTLDGRTWGERYYAELFPRLIAELDPTRAYIPGSPYSPSPLLSPNLPDEGTVHIWDVWNTKDYREYAAWKPRFVAEFGFQGPPAHTTLFDVVHDEPLRPDGPQMLVHQKAADGDGKLTRGYRGHFAEPRSIDEWHFVTQLNQAHAMRFGIAWFRSLTPRMSGTVIWQLNDDWPVISWAAVDFHERRKPLWYALQQVYAERFATLQPREGGGWELVIVNDHGRALVDGVTLRRTGFDGETHAEQTVHVDVEAFGVQRLAVDDAVMQTPHPDTQLVTATFDSGAIARVVHDLAEVVDQRLDPDAASVSVTETDTGAVVEVTATSYVRDVVILADRAHPAARVDRSLVSLLAGESATFTLTAAERIPAASAGGPGVVRTANQLSGPVVGTPYTTGARA